MENLRAMGLMIVAMACFATADGIIKLLAQDISKGQIMACMGLAGSVVFYWLCRREGTAVLNKLFFVPIIVARNAAEIIGTLAIFSALTLAPLSSVAAVLQAVPLVITVCAALILKESVGPRRWGAVVIGFIGVLIIVRPDGDGLDYALLFAVVGMICLSVRDIASRVAPKPATTPLLSFYAFLGLAPVGLILSFYSEGFDPINAGQSGLLLIMVALAVGGYFCVTNAMRIGEVSAVSPLRYTRMPFAVVVGFILFRETPDGPTLLGSALVIGAGMFVMLREAQIKRSAREA